MSKTCCFPIPGCLGPYIGPAQNSDGSPGLLMDSFVDSHGGLLAYLLAWFVGCLLAYLLVFGEQMHGITCQILSLPMMTTGIELREGSCNHPRGRICRPLL